MSDFGEKIKNISENQNVQKAKNAVSGAGKKIGDGLSNKAEGIKNSSAYEKAMENKHVQKVSGFLGKFDKKVRIGIIVGVIALIIILLVVIFSSGSSGSDVVIERDQLMESRKCNHECEAGHVGFYCYDKETVCIFYFTANADGNVYLIESEDGKRVETTAQNKESVYDYDADLESEDTNGDGYIDFVISKYTGSDYEKVCTVKCKL